MAFSIADPLNADPLNLGGTGFGLTQNYAAGPTSKPEWLQWIDDIVGAADKVTSIYERYDYPAWKRTLDAKEIEAYRAEQEKAKAAQAAGSAGGVPWVWVAVAAAGVVALVLVLK